MSKNIGSRLERPEVGALEGDIPVWCDTPEQVPEIIDAMIAEGEVRLEQRSRCVFWEDARCGHRAHEKSLENLA